MTNEINITHIKKTTINQITNYSIVEPKLITMKKTFTLIFAFCSFFMLAKGQVLLDETFDYSVANLELETTWTTGWTTDIGVGTGLNIVTPALTYITAEGTYVLSDLGKTINSDYTSGASNYSSYKPFTATPVTTTVYLSFLLNTGVAQNQSQSEVFGLGDVNLSGPKVWIGKGIITTTDYRLGTTRGSTTGADIKWGAAEFSDVAAVLLVVVKYDFSTSTSSLFINPILGSVSEPTADAFDNSTGATAIRTKLSTIRFRYNMTNGAKFNVSGARVSSSWADAVAISVPTKVSDVFQKNVNVKIYPNPVSNSINFEYNLLENANVHLDVYNMNNQVVCTFLNNARQSAGSYSKSFDVSGLKNGVYFARLTAGKITKSVKIVINR
jgi:hypothetical protein